MNNRIRTLISALEIKKVDFAKKLNISQSFVSDMCSGKSKPSDRTVTDICREFNVSETWLRTGEGDMFLPNPSGVLEELAREYELSPGMYVLIKRLLALKPENQQAAVDFAVKLAEDLNNLDPAPVVDAKSATTPPAGADIPVPATATDLAAKVAALERQNQEKDRQLEELAAKVAAMEEEDALLGLTGGFSISPGEFAGNLNPNAKK